MSPRIGRFAAIAVPLIGLILISGCSVSPKTPQEASLMPVESVLDADSVCTIPGLQLASSQLVDIPRGAVLREYSTLASGPQIRSAAFGETTESGEPVMVLTLDEDATNTIGNWTVRHVGGEIYVLLNGNVIASPRVSVPIIDGQVALTLPDDDARDLLESASVPFR